MAPCMTTLATLNRQPCTPAGIPTLAIRPRLRRSKRSFRQEKCSSSWVRIRHTTTSTALSVSLITVAKATPATSI